VVNKITGDWGSGDSKNCHIRKYKIYLTATSFNWMTSFKWSILAIVKKKLAAILRNTRYFLQVLFYFDRNPGVAKGLLKKKSNRKKSGLVGNYLWSTRYSGDVVQFHLIFLLETRLRDHLDFTSEQHFWHYYLFPLNIPCIQSNCMAIQLKNNTFCVTLLSYFLFLHCIRFFLLEWKQIVHAVTSSYVAIFLSSFECFSFY